MDQQAGGKMNANAHHGHGHHANPTFAPPTDALTSLLYSHHHLLIEPAASHDDAQSSLDALDEELRVLIDQASAGFPRLFHMLGQQMAGPIFHLACTAMGITLHKILMD